MSIRYSSKAYYFNQLPDSKGTLMTVPTGNKVYIRNIIFHNTNSTTENVILNLNNGTYDLQIFKKDIVANETFSWEIPEQSLVADSGDIISGSTTTAAKVTCAVMAQEGL